MAKSKRKKSAAVITIHRAGDMTERGRRDIAAWLRDHAKFLLKHGSDYAPRFTGRYTYV